MEIEPLALPEVQQLEMGLLIEFDSFCRAHDLRYSLGGGSLLGAVRHRGFIPWDDDIDVMMPRPDYELFLECYQRENPSFNLITYEMDEGYNDLFAKIWDPETRIEDDVVEFDYQIGVNIDVFPIDGLGNSKEKALQIFKKTRMDRELLNASHWKKYFRSRTHSILVEPIRLAMFVVSRFVSQKKLLSRIDGENRKHPFEASVYAGCVCGSYREREIMTTETFKNYIELEFEGQHFKAIENYDEYLRKHYGDYMQLPPENKRMTHHTYRAYRV